MRPHCPLRDTPEAVAYSHDRYTQSTVCCHRIITSIRGTVYRHRSCFATRSEGPDRVLVPVQSQHTGLWVSGRPKTPLTLTDDERIQLSNLARSRTLPHAVVARAKPVLWSSESESNSQIAARLHWTRATVGKWRQRFRLVGLYDELRPRRPAHYRGRAGYRSAETHAIAQARLRHALDGPRSGPCQRHFQIDRPPSVFRPPRCSPIARAPSNSPPIRLLSKKCATSQACT